MVKGADPCVWRVIQFEHLRGMLHVDGSRYHQRLVILNTGFLRDQPDTEEEVNSDSRRDQPESQAPFFSRYRV